MVHVQLEVEGMRRHITGIVLVSMLVAACSGDDEPEAAEPTTASTDASVSSPPTDPPSTTDPPVITNPSTTTSTSTTTTSSTTTTTTTTTTTPPVSTDAAVDAFEELNALDEQCLAAMPNCDVSFYADYIGGRQLQRAIDQMEGWQAMGYSARNLESLASTIEEVRPANSDPDRIDIEYCAEDGSVLVASDGSIVNDEFWSNRLIAEMRLDPDGRWRVHSYTLVGTRVVGEENSICR